MCGERTLRREEPWAHMHDGLIDGQTQNEEPGRPRFSPLVPPGSATHLPKAGSLPLSEAKVAGSPRSGDKGLQLGNQTYRGSNSGSTMCKLLWVGHISPLSPGCSSVRWEPH